MELYTPSHYIIESAQHPATRFHVLGKEEADDLRKDILNKFAAGNPKVIWQDLLSSASVHDPNAWRWIDSYLSGNSFVLFFDEQEDKSMFQFPPGTRLTPILEECPGFEFYVTDYAATYLLCFNHHDYLIAAGRAEAWLANYLHGTTGG